MRNKPALDNIVVQVNMELGMEVQFVHNQVTKRGQYYTEEGIDQ